MTSGRAAVTCGARRRKSANTEVPCLKPAGWGTDHPGVGACRIHGGGSRVGVKASARPGLELLVGHAVDVSPMEALIMCVRITSAEVAYFSFKISELSEDELVVRPRAQSLDRDGMTHDLKQQKQLNIWIRERQKALQALGRFSKMALDAGVEERLVLVAESAGKALARALDGILKELNLNEKQRRVAPEVVRRHLFALERKA